MSEVPPFDLDVTAMDPGDMARVLVSRSFSERDTTWAEIGWDVKRYPHVDDLVAVLLGFLGQCLAPLAEQQGVTAPELWRAMMLAEAEREAT